MKHKTIQEAIGIFIYTERTKQKLSQAQLAEKAFANPNWASQIGKIEKGTVENVSVKTIASLMKALNYDMRHLFKK